MTRWSIILIGLAVIALMGMVMFGGRGKTAAEAASAAPPAAAASGTRAPVDRAETLRWAKERPAPAQPKAESLSATFALEDGKTVTLDYIDARNYRFTTQNSVFQTYVLDGKIYLYAPADDTQPERIWLYGRLGAASSQAQADQAQPVLKPTTIPAAGVLAWGDIGPVYDVIVSRSGPIGIPVDATVARAPSLARAQWSIVTLLLPAMDMSLCGNGVQAVTSWWPQDLTGAGFAIVATSAGVRLDGPLRTSPGPLSLPGKSAIIVHPLARL